MTEANDEEKRKDDLTGYGVKGDLKAEDDTEEKGAINKENSTKFTEEDKKTLSSISSKINGSIENLAELVNVLDAYSKVNQKPVMTVINQLKSFKEAVDKELSSI